MSRNPSSEKKPSNLKISQDPSSERRCKIRKQIIQMCTSVNDENSKFYQWLDKHHALSIMRCIDQTLLNNMLSRRKKNLPFRLCIEAYYMEKIGSQISEYDLQKILEMIHWSENLLHLPRYSQIMHCFRIVMIRIDEYFRLCKLGLIRPHCSFLAFSLEWNNHLTK